MDEEGDEVENKAEVGDDDSIGNQDDFDREIKDEEIEKELQT